MKLAEIPQKAYGEYRLDIVFDGYKWDPQFCDHNTVAKHALILSGREAREIMELTDKLSVETIAAENYLLRNMDAAKPLRLPHQIKNLLQKSLNYVPDGHLRLMRFDFHPVEDGGWAVSEVNSDVPGGFAEGSLMPQIAAKYLKQTNLKFFSFGERFVEEVKKLIPAGGTVAFVHCTCYSDDRQMVQFLGDRLEQSGYKALYVASDHLRFENGKAQSILSGHETEVDFIFRFTPVEWLLGTKPKTWHGYFDTVTPSCNHPIVVFAQTKRFPLLFSALEQAGIDLSAWRKLLPETLDLKSAQDKEGFILKPAYGRVGEGIGIQEACEPGEYQEILKNAKRRQNDYIAQKMFQSRPLTAPDGGQFHICLGSYSLGGKFAGFYARIGSSRRIDANAADMPVLVDETEAE